MSNEIVAFKNAGLPISDPGQFAKALAIGQATIAIKSGGDFLKLDKHDGLWKYGTGETEVQEGSHWAINPKSLMMGFISWGTKGDVLGKKLNPIGMPVDPSTLANTGARWDECIAMDLRCMNGEDEGTQVIYEQNSYGAKKAFMDVLQALQLQLAKDPANLVPVVLLESDSYQHKTYGKIYNPIFTIVKFVGMGGTPVQDENAQGDDTPATTAATPAPAPKAAAKQKRAAVGGAAPVADVQTTAPLETAKPAVTRQRRRAVA